MDTDAEPDSLSVFIRVIRGYFSPQSLMVGHDQDGGDSSIGIILLARESNLQKKDGHDLPTAPKGISLTPNFSWVAAGLRRTIPLKTARNRLIFRKSMTFSMIQKPH